MHILRTRVLTTVLRTFGLPGVFSLLLLWSACGDTFRPVVIPNPPTPPDPSNAHTVVAITNNGSFNPGSIMLLDVSGDTTQAVGNVGRGPTHVALVPPGAAHIAIANAVDDTVTLISSSSASALLTPTTISLPSGSAPAFVHSMENGFFYVANSGNATVAVVNTTTNAVTNVIPLAAPNPVSLAETPDGKKVYVASQGGGVTSINSVDKSPNPLITDASINAPISVAARSDSARVYVLSQGNGDVTTIDTFSDTVIPPVTQVAVGAGADFMLYDSRLNRLYVTNSTAGTLSVLDAAQDTPLLLATINLPAGPNAACPVGCASVAPLPNGSGVYASTLQVANANVAAVVTMINPLNNSVVKTVNLPAVTALPACNSTRFRITTTASADSSRVYLGNCDAGNIAIIRASDATPLVNLPAPVSAATGPTLTIPAASQSGLNTTYSYAIAKPPAPPLQIGMSVVIKGFMNTDDGTFAITALGPGTFTVLNPSGVTAVAQNGTGVATPPLQSPVFVLAGP
jgi:YVTN family beta-propeller protein